MQVPEIAEPAGKGDRGVSSFLGCRHGDGRLGMRTFVQSEAVSAIEVDTRELKRRSMHIINIKPMVSLIKLCNKPIHKAMYCLRTTPDQ